MRSAKGSTLLEFTLVGIPVIFVLISTIEMARGMWMYHTLCHAVKEGARFAIVHGENCAKLPNSCTITAGDVAARIRDAGPGLLPEQMTVTLWTPSTTKTKSLSELLNENDVWPPASSNAMGVSVEISATYPFQSAISMFWPGNGPGFHFGVFNLPAVSRQQIEF